MSDKITTKINRRSTLVKGSTYLVKFRNKNHGRDFSNRPYVGLNEVDKWVITNVFSQVGSSLLTPEVSFVRELGTLCDHVLLTDKNVPRVESLGLSVSLRLSRVRRTVPQPP